MKSTLLAGALLSALLFAPAIAQSPPESDADFVKMAAVGNTFEIDEAKIAEQRATDPRLKQFAQKMIADHGQAMRTLQDAAGKAGDKTEMALDPSHQARLDSLQTFNGTDFDKIYIADQIAAHAETVALLSDYKQNGKNDDLSSWAKTTLPVVKQHQADIDAM